MDPNAGTCGGAPEWLASFGIAIVWWLCLTVILLATGLALDGLRWCYKWVHDDLKSFELMVVSPVDLVIVIFWPIAIVVGLILAILWPIRNRIRKRKEYLK